MGLLKILFLFLSINFPAIAQSQNITRYIIKLNEEELTEIKNKAKERSTIKYPTYLKMLPQPAEQGDVLAQYELGKHYYNLFQDLTDPKRETYNKEALRWFKKAAKQGHAKAQYMVWTIYYNEGVFDKAFKWIKKSAQQGVAQSQYMTGMMLVYGRGIPQNIEKAFDWLEKAAKQGHLQAYEIVADKKESIRFFEKMIQESKRSTCKKIFSE